MSPYARSLGDALSQSSARPNRTLVLFGGATDADILPRIAAPAGCAGHHRGDGTEERGRLRGAPAGTGRKGLHGPGAQGRLCSGCVPAELLCHRCPFGCGDGVRREVGGGGRRPRAGGRADRGYREEGRHHRGVGGRSAVSGDEERGDLALLEVLADLLRAPGE